MIRWRYGQGGARHRTHRGRRRIHSFAGAALGMAGYRVILSKSGWESLSICREHEGPIDLAILDVVMPGLSGGELQQELLKLFPSIPIVFTSGYPHTHLDRFGISFTAASFLQKPFTSATLLETVENRLNQPAGPA